MAKLIPLGQFAADDRSGNHFWVSRVNHNGGTNTIDLPGGLVSAAALMGSTGATAPTVSVTQGADTGVPSDGGPSQDGVSDQTQGATVTQSRVTLTGGDSGEVYVVSRHVGSAANL